MSVCKTAGCVSSTAAVLLTSVDYTRLSLNQTMPIHTVLGVDTTTPLLSAAGAAGAGAGAAGAAGAAAGAAAAFMVCPGDCSLFTSSCCSIERDLVLKQEEHNMGGTSPHSCLSWLAVLV